MIGLGSITDTGLTGAGGVSETDSLGDFSISDSSDSVPRGVVDVLSRTVLRLNLRDYSRISTYTVVLKEPTLRECGDYRQVLPPKKCRGGSAWRHSGRHRYPDVHQ